MMLTIQLKDDYINNKSKFALGLSTGVIGILGLMPYVTMDKLADLGQGFLEMEVQGSEVQVNKMLSFIQQDHYIRIDQLHASNLIIKNNEYGFHVKGY